MDWHKGVGTTPLEMQCSFFTKVHCQVDRYIDYGEVLKLFGCIVMAVLTPLLLMVSTAVRLLTRMVSHRLAMWDCTLGKLVSCWVRRKTYSPTDDSLCRTNQRDSWSRTSDYNSEIDTTRICSLLHHYWRPSYAHQLDLLHSERTEGHS